MRKNNKIHVKREKINSSINPRDRTQIGSPSQTEVNDLLNQYQEERYDVADKLARSIINRFPNHQLSWKVLAAALKQTGKLLESLSASQTAVKLVPRDAEAHYNLGNTLQELGRTEEAEASFKKALTFKPDFVLANYNLGNALKKLGRLEEAELSYRKAIMLKPDHTEAHYSLCAALLENNNFSAAFDAAVHLIKTKPTDQVKILFIEAAKKVNPIFWDSAISKLVMTALLESWGRPSDLMPFACRLLKTDPEFMQALERSIHARNQDNSDDIFVRSFREKSLNSSPLLLTMLSSSPIPDVEIEIFLTALRRQFLIFVTSVIFEEGEANVVANLYCALARQCFINEYVYFQTPEEIDESEHLRDRLKKALESEEVIPAILVIVVACYFPLYSFPRIEKLLRQAWSLEVKAVLTQQIEEPFLELNLRKSIACLTNIENQVSLAVQSQYEENPYPRWMHLAKYSNKKFINLYIEKKFPLARFQRLAKETNPEILIAGCGTGHHSIGIAQSIRGAVILAIDLSLASLAFARRKTLELGIESIEYAQADILKLGSLGRTFDVVESSGVLHHLEHPFLGWEVLLSLLRSNGLMRLGFYSELARRDIVRVRDLIRQEGIGSSSQEIRRYRRHLLELKETENYGFATSSTDFFSTSMCRDLLFHVQEHRLNLSTLAIFIRDHDLNFLGFEINTSVVQSYKSRFPNDPSATNLDNWRAYEDENPDTFIGMYQFWVQKN